MPHPEVNSPNPKSIAAEQSGVSKYAPGLTGRQVQVVES
jgi:hypothetical protein